MHHSSSADRNEKCFFSVNLQQVCPADVKSKSQLDKPNGGKIIKIIFSSKDCMFVKYFDETNYVAVSNMINKGAFNLHYFTSY